MATPKRKSPRQKLAPSAGHQPVASLRSSRENLPPSGKDAQLTESARRWCGELGALVLSERVVVVWNRRLRTTAGTACTRTACIELNPLLRSFGPAQVERTLKHEAAHLLAHWRVGRRAIQSHGVEWQRACADLGIAGEPAFHELPLPRRRIARKYAYRCRHCGFTVQRVRQFGPYTACYKCCQKYTGGAYHSDYLFIRVPFPATLR